MKFLIILVIVVLAVCAFIFLQPGKFLIVNNAEKSDAIVVLGGDSADQRYWRGMDLLRAGYARHMFVDATTGVAYGHSFVDLAKEYIGQTAGANASQVSVCRIVGDSTKIEAQQVNACLQTMQPAPQSVIIATDDYHTRRALSIFRNRAAAVPLDGGGGQSRVSLRAALVEEPGVGQDLSDRVGEAAVVGAGRSLAEVGIGPARPID